MIVFLDSEPAGLVTNPNGTPETVACQIWLNSIINAGHQVVLPDIIDYEVRRELIRAKKRVGLDRLNQLHNEVTYVSVDKATLYKAAEFWAIMRQRGRPTANNKALDIDMILAAQAWQYQNEGEFVIIATTNKKHLTEFVPAENWKDIHAI